MEYSLKQIALICGGKLFGDENITVSEFVTDSREAQKGKMFVAIVGEKTDGHSYLPSVFEKNCPAFCEKMPIEKGNFILVENSVKALQIVALHHRNQNTIPHIAVTGSVGKTTTKEMLALTLESQLNVLKTLGNANSQIGLPKTLMRVDKSHQVALIEMGMSVPGEMEKIAFCARPDMVVFTNVGVSHIEFHGSREKIMEQKLHIADYFTENSTMFVNGDDDLLCTLKGNASYNVIEFGLSQNCQYRAVKISENDVGTNFSCLVNGEKIAVFVPTLGLHNVHNALACIAVSDKLGLDRAKSIKALATYCPPEMRQQIIKTANFTIIDDSYNASPDSMQTALQVLGSAKGRKIAVLADMLELGEYSQKGHTDVGVFAKKADVDCLICFGQEAKYIQIGFENEQKSKHFTSYEQAEKYLLSMVTKGDTILCKGSRGMKTDRFVKALRGE